VGIPFSNNQVASQTYAASGNYTISVHGKNLNSADNCNALAQPFTALAVLPTPAINTLTALDPNRLRLDFSAAPHLQLHLEIAVNNSNTFQLFQTLYGVSSDTVSNIKLDDNYYCFRLSAYDPCTGGNTYSNTVCSQKFTVTPQSDINQLAWITSAAGVADATQIHTHMCYSEFNDIIQDIADMDADVITIECSRSQMELLDAFAGDRYERGIKDNQGLVGRAEHGRGAGAGPRISNKELAGQAARQHGPGCRRLAASSHEQSAEGHCGPDSKQA